MTSFLQTLWSFLRPFFAQALTAFNEQLVALKPVVLAEVAALATKDAPAVLAVIESKISIGGVFGGEIKSLLIGYLTSALPNLESELGNADGAWYDEVVALIEKEEVTLGLEPDAPAPTTSA